MKRNLDLVREILLKIEDANEDRPSLEDVIGWKEGDPPIEKSVRERYAYHVRMLIQQAGLVTGLDASSMQTPDWLELELTWQGHDFLDNTRSSVVWEKTKEGMTKIGGAGWEIMVGVAKAYAKQVARERLGIDLG